MSRTLAISMATAYFDDGRFQDALRRRVAVRTESENAASAPILLDYLSEHIMPELQALGFTQRVVENPIPGNSPFLIAERIEADAAFTILTYGHGDVVDGDDNRWREGFGPWDLVLEGDRWYGRGTADNKGQHTINLAALAQVLNVRNGTLGYNVKIIFEMGEETGSTGLIEVCERYKEALAADVFLASDGPRLSALKPTIFLGTRGCFDFDLRVKARDGAHHSGNWGGLLSNPAVRLTHALASMVDRNGRILVPTLLPKSLPDAVRRALASVEVGRGSTDPVIDPNWGEPGLTPPERVFGWNTLEVLAYKTGNPDLPSNAIPANAYARCQLRFVVGTDYGNLLRHIRSHLDAGGFTDVEVEIFGTPMAATRLDPDDAWVRWATASIESTTGTAAWVLPNLGGSLSNDAFSEVLGLPTIWVPHSYPACSQHAPGEHLLGSIAREALQIMAGMFWDLGEQGPDVMTSRSGHGS